MTFISLPSLFRYLVYTSSSPFSFPDQQGHPHQRPAVYPTVSGIPELLGVASDPIWNRDSCTSTRVRDRELWTCRDSISSTGFHSSTASWTNFTSDGVPAVSDELLLMYGDNLGQEAYFPVQKDECGGSGECDNGSRFVIWPNTRPLPVDAGLDGSMALYTWIPKAHLASDLAEGRINQNPAGTLYRADFTPGAGPKVLPPAIVVDEEFWPSGSILYGTYGYIIHDDMAYLYGHLANMSHISLAKVPIRSVEDKSAYRYWTGHRWSNTAPRLFNDSAAVPNAGSGRQGTFYYSA